MKTIVPFLFLLCFLEIPGTKAATSQEARVSQVIQDVRVLASNAAPRPAVVNDKIGEGNAVRTGAQSRAELTFSDLTITRLGENTMFSLNQSAREVHVENGSVLVEVPPKSASVKMTSAVVTAAIQGGTAIFATGPPTKFLVLEGIGTFYPTGHPELAITLHAGEMTMRTLDGHLSKPQQFNVKAVVESSGLIVGFPDLKNLPLILDVIDLQIVPPAPSPPPSQDTLNAITTAANSNPILAPPAPSATPIGPPTITSPNPYSITSATTIVTDPTITSNGIADVGKIYQGPAIDGPASKWAFGSTSAFDTESGFDSHITGSGAAFKFSSLQLAGDPTVSIAGGQTALGLIGVNGITSGAPGGSLSFAGINDLLLATQNGSITLGPEISFNLPNSFEAYARGSGSNLTLGSAVTTGGNVRLIAQGSIQVNGALNTGAFHAFAGTDFLAGTGPISATSSIDIHADHDVTLDLNQFAEGANTGQSVSVDAGHDININATGDQSVFSQASTISLTAANAVNITGSSPTTLNLTVENNGNQIGIGGDISLTAGTDLTSSTGINLSILNTTGTIDTGGNITLTTGGSLSTQGQLSLVVENFDISQPHPAGHIGTGGNIAVTTGGDLTANSISAVVNNGNGGTIDSGGTLVFNVGGTLTTLGEGTDYRGFPSSLSLNISNKNLLGSKIGSDALLELNAGGANIGGDLTAIIRNRGGGIVGNALVSFDITHDLVAQGGADLEILNDDLLSPIPGTVEGNATLQVNANNFTADSLFAQIDNKNGGLINSAAALNFDLTGSLTTPGTNSSDFTPASPGNASFQIQNQQTSAGATGGSIQGPATLSLTATTISAAGDFDADIQNQRDPRAPGLMGGSIGSNATVTISATSLSVGGELDTFISNRNNNSGTGTGGNIGGNAAINVSLSGDLITTGLDSNSSGTPGNANFQIQNQSNNAASPGGSIGSDASITIGAQNVSTAGSFDAVIDNHNGGSIGGNAAINVTTTGDITTHGLTQFYISNIGGTIGGNATISLQANSISITAPPSTGLEVQASPARLDLYAAIDNRKGTISGGDSVNVNVTGAISIAGGLRVLGNVTAGGDINVGNLKSTNVSTPGAINVTNRILPFTYLDNGSLSSSVVHTITADSITAGGGINFNGISAKALSAPTDGGQLTINASSVSFGPEGDIQGPVTFNGGNGSAIGEGVVPGANGGVLTVNTLGDITVDSSILATTGLEPVGISYSGNGGTVNLKSAQGTVTIANRIQVSSAAPLQDSTGSPVPGARSANGGNIYIESDTAGSPLGNGPATAIATTSSSQLLALLGTSGTGGTITMFAPGSNSAITLKGNIEADSGTIDIRDTGDNSEIDLNAGNSSLTNAITQATDTITMRSDIIKVGVLGSNGTLNIGAGLLSADTLLELYAPGSNGTINFVANVTLGGAAKKIIAGDTVNIFNGVVVMIRGNTPVSVFTNNANYSGSGGNGSTTGTFGGAGAITQSLSQAPPFGTSPAAPSTLTSAGAQSPGPGAAISSNSSSLQSGKSNAPTKLSSANAVAPTGAVRAQNERPGDVILSKISRNREVRISSASINIGNSGELLSLLDNAKPGANGQITISDPKKRNVSGNSGAGNLTGRSKTAPAAVNREATRDRKPMPTQFNPARSFPRAAGM